VFTEPAELYDAIYFGFKDYGAEADRIASMLRSLHQGCRAILDVACGTGEHARLLATRHGFEVDGVDLNEDFLRLARLKHPGGRFTRADMRSFQLARKYDAICCLFSSIGYLGTLDRVTDALRCFTAHLAEGGVILVEPWFPPGVLEPGRRSTHVGEANGLRVERTSQVEVVDRLSRLRFDYVITGPGGERRTTELHELGLFTVPEMMGAFADAGLTAEYEEGSLSGRGLYVARAGGNRAPPIRRGGSADAAALAEFAARMFARTFGPDNRPADLAAHLAESYGVAQQSRELADPEYVTLLADGGDGLAAFAQVRRHEPPACVTGPAPVELYRFYVDAPWQGRGLARRLMAAVHAAAAELGGRTLWLSVWERNPRARAFYAKCGFQDAGATDFYVGPDRQTDRVLVAPVAAPC
jgi:GNAT superfamily N-acetyltransferase/SAM-dependent methyltransferase